MTRTTGCFADECSGTADESSVSSSSDNHESLASFDSGGSITIVTLVLINGERFSGNGRLINLDESVLGDDATIGRDNGTFLDLNNVTGNDFGSLDFQESTVSKSDSFKGKSFLQLFDN
jgi:hypothetical protein